MFSFFLDHIIYVITMLAFIAAFFNTDVYQNVNIVEIKKDNIELKIEKIIENEVNSALGRQVFFEVYAELNNLINDKIIQLSYNKPLQALKYTDLNIKQNNKFKTFEDTHLQEVIKRVQMYAYMEKLSAIYVFPYFADKFFYKIIPKKFEVELLPISIKEQLSNEKFYKFEFPNRTVYINKQELIDNYINYISPIIDVSKAFEDSYDSNILKLEKEIEQRSRIKVTFAFIAFLLFSIAYFYVISSNKRKQTTRDKELIESQLLNIKHKESKLEESRKKLADKENTLNTMSHILTHDFKTNADKLTNILYKLFNILEEKKCLQHEGITSLLLELYGIELTIKKANDFSKQSGFDRYDFKKMFFDEDIFIFFMQSEKGYIDELLIENIFNVNINADKINNFIMKAPENQKFYDNELSGAFFRLLNNCLKHKKQGTQVNLEIKEDENNDFHVIISNYLMDEADCHYTKYMIDESLNDNDGKNLSIVKNILEKYGLIIEIECRDTQVITSIRRGKENV